jgi:hypothetical protein
MRSTFLEGIEYCVTNPFPFLPEPGIPEPQFLDAPALEILPSFSVMHLLFGMTVSNPIQLDGQSGLLTEEIERVTTDRMLAAKLVTVKSPITKPTPHQFFSPSGSFAQCASALPGVHASRLFSGLYFGKHVKQGAVIPPRLGDSPWMGSTDPEPALTPTHNQRERENHRQSTGCSDYFRKHTVTRGNHDPEPLAVGTSKSSIDPNHSFLFPGERAGVRAS